MSFHLVDGYVAPLAESKFHRSYTKLYGLNAYQCGEWSYEGEAGIYTVSQKKPDPCYLLQ